MKREDDTSEVELEGAGEPIWHVAVSEGRTQGPYTAGELSGLRAGGTIQDTMLVWRDGWPDWRPLGEVGEIVDAPPLELTTAGAGAASAGSNGFDVAVSMGDDPFAGDSVPPGPTATLAGYAAPRPVRSPAGARTPLARAGANESAVSMGADPFATGESPAASPRVSASEAMTPGQQRDGTVEINLAEFRRLSMTTTAQPTGLAPTKTGGREDSGLIDVRKVAEAGEAAGAAAAARGSYEVIGIPTGAGLKAPRRPMDFRTKLLVGVGAFAGLLFFVVLAVALLRDSPEELAAATREGAASPADAPVSPAAPIAPVAKAAGDAPAADSEGAPADEGEIAEETESEEPASDRPSGQRRRRTARSQRSTSSEPSSPTATKSKGGDSIDDLLGRALEGGGKSAAAKPKPDTSSLAATPTRDQVVTAMNGVKNKVGACGDSGVATVKLVVSGSTGRVTSAAASGVTGTVKSCVERAAKGARFPKFKQASFTVSYPFRL